MYHAPAAVHWIPHAKQAGSGASLPPALAMDHQSMNQNWDCDASRPAHHAVHMGVAVARRSILHQCPAGRRRIGVSNRSCVDSPTVIYLLGANKYLPEGIQGWMTDLSMPGGPGDEEPSIDLPAATQPPMNSYTQQLVDELATLVRLSRRISDVSLFGLTWLHYAVLRCLALAKTEVRITDMADNLCYDISVVSRQINMLIEAGLVERVRDPNDGRAWLVRLSPAGQARWQKAADRSVDWFRGLLTDFTDADQARAVTVIGALNRSIPEALRGQLSATSPPPANA